MYLKYSYIQAMPHPLVSKLQISLPNPKNPRNIVITGSSKGIGKAIAKKCFLDGHNVIICSRNKENTLSTYHEFMELAEKDENCGFVYPLNVDVTNYKDCQTLIKQSIQKLGSIDIWINNSGVSYKKLLIDTSKDEIDSIIDTNLKGTIYCSRLIIPVMLEQKSKSILINLEGAGSNSLPTPNYSIYGSTKSAVTQFTKTLSQEYAKSDIRFCTISPGMVITDLLLSNCTDSMKVAFNIFGEKPDTVAKYVVNEMYKIRHNSNIRYLTVNRIILMLFLYPCIRNRHFNNKGEQRHP